MQKKGREETFFLPLLLPLLRSDDDPKSPHSPDLRPGLASEPNNLLYFPLSLDCSSSSRVSYRYHLAHCTHSHELEQKQTLYVSQPETHQVLRVRRIPNLDLSLGGIVNPEEAVSASEASENFEPFIGSGERCLPGDSDHCGDGGPASEARLAYPKGEVKE